MIKKVTEQNIDSPILDGGQLTGFIRFIKKRIDFEELKNCDIVSFLEFIIPEYFDSDFSLDCISVHKWIYGEAKVAVCDYDNHSIIIRDDIYRAAYEQKPECFFIIRVVCKYLFMLYTDLLEKKEDCIMKNRKNSSY